MAKQKGTTANAAIRDFYQLGLRIQRADQKSPKRGNEKRNWGVFKQIHEETDISRTEFEKARLFVKHFTPDDVDWLCELGRDQGSVLTKSHVVFLLNVPDKRTRRSLANRASKEGWPIKRLASEIRKKRPRQSLGGRRPPRPKTVVDALVEIERATEKWLRLYKTLQPPDTEDEAHGVSVRDLAPTVRSAMKKAATELRVLHSKVQRKIDAR